MIGVASIDKLMMVAELTDGRIVPITNLLDEFGDMVGNWSQADRFVCGAGDLWFACPLENFIERTVH